MDARTLAPIELPIRVTGMDDYRRALAEIRRGAATFQKAGLGVTVNIYVGSFPEPKKGDADV